MIVGLSGKKQVGKDTCAAFLIAKGFKRVSFADSLKEITSKATGIPLAFMHDNYAKELQFAPQSFDGMEFAIALDKMYGLDTEQILCIDHWFQNNTFTSIRDLLQRFGTDCARDMIDKDIWVNIALRSLNVNEDYVIADLRFRSEVDCLKPFNHKLIKIIRSTGFSDGHKSENQDLPDELFDGIIDNNGSLEELKTKLEGII